MKSLNPIFLPADPTEPLHAATKQYVDGVAAGIVLSSDFLAHCSIDLDTGRPLWDKMFFAFETFDTNYVVNGYVYSDYFE